MAEAKPRKEYVSGNYRTAKYRGKCQWCGEYYIPGEKVNWNPRVKGTVCHAGCYAYYGAPTPHRLSGGSDYTPTPNPTPTPNRTVDVSKLNPVEDTTPEVTPEFMEPASTPLGSTIADAIAPYLENRLKGLVTEQQVKSVVEKVLANAILKTVTTVTVESKDEFGEVEHKDMGLCHKTFPLLLNTVKAKTHDGYSLNVWLTGPAGTGKTTAAKMVAEALGLNYYFCGSIDTEYKLTGFVDAQGHIINTTFRTAYQLGGVFLFDECDSSLPAALLAFNAALANDSAAFPDKIVPRHKDFICIAAANTWGLGATNEYVGRLKLDAAFLDRFVQIYWDVDESLETAICPNREWSGIVQAYRARLKAKGIKGCMITPRASIFGASLLAVGIPMEQVKAMTIRKAMTDEQWASIQ